MTTLGKGNPLIPLVKQIESASRFVNEEVANRLYEIIKEHLPEKSKTVRQEEEEEKLAPFSIDAALSKQLKTLERLQMLAASSEDVAEVKSIISASSTVISQMNKLKDDVDAERALRIMEDAVIQALDELGDVKISERFRQLVAEKTKHAREVRRS